MALSYRPGRQPFPPTPTLWPGIQFVHQLAYDPVHRRIVAMVDYGEGAPPQLVLLHAKSSTCISVDIPFHLATAVRLPHALNGFTVDALFVSAVGDGTIVVGCQDADSRAYDLLHLSAFDGRELRPSVRLATSEDSIAPTRLFVERMNNTETGDVIRAVVCTIDGRFLIAEWSATSISEAAAPPIEGHTEHFAMRSLHWTLDNLDCATQGMIGTNAELDVPGRNGDRQLLIFPDAYVTTLARLAIPRELIPYDAKEEPMNQPGEPATVTRANPRGVVGDGYDTTFPFTDDGLRARGVCQCGSLSTLFAVVPSAYTKEERSKPERVEFIRFDSTKGTWKQVGLLELPAPDEVSAARLLMQRAAPRSDQLRKTRPGAKKSSPLMQATQKTKKQGRRSERTSDASADDGVAQQPRAYFGFEPNAVLFIAWCEPGRVLVTYHATLLSDPPIEMTNDKVVCVMQAWVRHVPWSRALHSGAVPGDFVASLRMLTWLRWRVSQASTAGMKDEGEILAGSWARLPLEIYEQVVERLWDEYLSMRLMCWA